MKCSPIENNSINFASVLVVAMEIQNFYDICIATLKNVIFTQTLLQLKTKRFFRSILFPQFHSQIELVTYMHVSRLVLIKILNNRNII